MKLLETTAATIEFEIVEDPRRDADPRLVDAVRQNDKLWRALHEARNEIVALRAEADKLSAPPSTYGVYLSAHDDDTSTSSRRDGSCAWGSTPRSRSSRSVRARSCCSTRP